MERHTRHTLLVVALVWFLATGASCEAAAASRSDQSVADLGRQEVAPSDHEPRLLMPMLRVPRNMKYSYYKDFLGAVQRVVPHCVLEKRDCPWQNGSSWHAGEDPLPGWRIVFLVDHGSTSSLAELRRSLKGISRELRGAQRVTRAQMGLLVGLNKVYADGAQKMFEICQARGRLGVPIVVLSWSPRLVQQSQELCNDSITRHLHFAVDPTRFNRHSKRWERRRFDIYFSGDLSRAKYPNRGDVLQALKDAHMRVFNAEKYLHEKWYVRTIHSSRIVFSTIGYPPSARGGHFDIIGTRYFEAMATGSVLLLCDRSSAYEGTGLVENVTAAMFSTPEEAVRVATYYLKHPREALDIAKRARDLVLAIHTWEHRARTVMSILREDHLWN